MKKMILSAIIGAMMVGVAIVAIIFFWKNPFREGEITIATPNGPSVTFKVANSNEISELIRKGLENEKTQRMLTYSLLSIIENLPPGNTLGEKLVELVEQRRPPFSANSVPVKLAYDPNVPPGLAAVCDNSRFLAKPIVVFVLNNDGELLGSFQAYVDCRLTFPCPAGGEILRVNSMEVDKFNRYQVLAKRNF